MMYHHPGAGKKIHVPFRRSKLTLLLKDVFDFSCARLCATVVVAAVSPLARDAAHSTNTLKYAAPLRVAVRQSKGQMEVDQSDPALWNNDKIVEWMQGIISKGCVDSGPDHATLLANVWKGAAGQVHGLGVGPDVHAEGHEVEVEAARARKVSFLCHSLTHKHTHTHTHTHARARAQHFCITEGSCCGCYE